MKKHCLNVWHWWCLINIMDMRFTLEPWRDLTWRYVGPTSTGPSLLELQQRRDSNWRSLGRFILQKDIDHAVRSNWDAFWTSYTSLSYKCIQLYIMHRPLTTCAATWHMRLWNIMAVEQHETKPCLSHAVAGVGLQPKHRSLHSNTL